jgi:hypothetical protein
VFWYCRCPVGVMRTDVLMTGMELIAVVPPQV